MKPAFLFLLAVASIAPCRAQWAVIDVASIKQSAMNYAALVEQLSNQASQITNQIQQIQQFETQLKRMGDMASVKNIVGFPELRVDLDLPSKIETWAKAQVRVDGRGIFGDTRGGIYREISSDFPDFDGARVERNPVGYKESHDITVTVDEFKTVQNDVYVRRENLKRAIAETSDALRAAETEAEQKKLSAVLSAQYAQLSSIDSEVALSAAQVQVKAAEATAMHAAENEANAEARRRLAQQEARKVTDTFKPKYECWLQYVSETRIDP